MQGSADVDPLAQLGPGTTVWHLAQVREHARLGEGCIIGRGAYIGTGVVLGRNVKVQNHALVYEPAVVGDNAFIGPAVVFTNDRNPRSTAPDGTRKSGDDWDAVGVTVGVGASIGARSVVLGGVHIGDWSMVGAGSVVLRDVPAHGLVVGNPGRQVGWVGHAGLRLEEVDGRWSCPESGRSYKEVGGVLKAVD